jgi:hypothetical protein
MYKLLIATLFAVSLAGLSACQLLHPLDHQQGWGQRACLQSVDCARLVDSACGDDDRCSNTLSCRAAKRLRTSGDNGVCHSAWCDLGESYRECGL